MSYSISYPYPLVPDENKPDKLKNSAFLATPLNRFLVPRPPLKSIGYLDRDATKRIGPVLFGMSRYMDALKGALKEPYTGEASPRDKRLRKREEKSRKLEENLSNAIKNWRPTEDPKAKGDAYNTLFVGRLNYATSERQLKREFERYGPIRLVRIVVDKQKKSRGYAFIEFERERDLKYAYKDADGLKLDSRRIVVDIERGRTVKGWRPRRLGQGLGGTRIGGKTVNHVESGRDPRAEERSKPVIMDHHRHDKPPPHVSSHPHDARSRSPRASKRKHTVEEEGRHEHRDHRQHAYAKRHVEDEDRYHNKSDRHAPSRGSYIDRDNMKSHDFYKEPAKINYEDGEDYEPHPHQHHDARTLFRDHRGYLNNEQR